MTGSIRLVGALFLGYLSLSPTAASTPSRRPMDLPQVMLWAWERPTDLRRLEPGVGVAFLAQTITLEHDTFRVAPRRHPLRVSPLTPLVAVTRIERRPRTSVSLERDMLDDIAALVTRTMEWSQVRAVQIDFDAIVSDREWYRRLLVEARRRLGPKTPLSMTALASWCVGDRWLDGLPVDEAVPMLFRMGPVDGPYAEIGIAPRVAASSCRDAVGTSLDEPLLLALGPRRLYVFNDAAWTDASIGQVRRMAQRDELGCDFR